MCEYCNERKHTMNPDDDDSEINHTDEAFVNMVNSNDWAPEKTLQYRIVENVTMTGITLGVVLILVGLAGAVVWVWRNALG